MVFTLFPNRSNHTEIKFFSRDGICKIVVEIRTFFSKIILYTPASFNKHLIVKSSFMRYLPNLPTFKFNRILRCRFQIRIRKIQQITFRDHYSYFIFPVLTKDFQSWEKLLYNSGILHFLSSFSCQKFISTNCNNKDITLEDFTLPFHICTLLPVNIVQP